MKNEKEKTAVSPSKSEEKRQSDLLCSNNRITDKNEKIKRNTTELIDKSSDLKTVNMSDLFDTIFENSEPLIDGLIYDGLYLFAGSPKIGKSFLASQIGYHISAGLPLWNYKVHQAGVLYLALEDSYDRLQKRLYQMFGTEIADNLYLATECLSLNGGLEEQISGFMTKYPLTRLIIIDTLQRIRESVSDYSYSNDYDVILKLKNIADSYRITIIIIHHTRKQKSDDVFDMISGTNGLLGAADGAFILSKDKRTSNKGVLNITGRDQQDQKIHLVRDTKRLTWEFEKAETELWKEEPEPLLKSIHNILSSESNYWEGTSTELCNKLKLDIKPNALSYKLNVNAHILFKEFGIKYTNTRGHKGRKLKFRLNEGKRDDA